MPEKTSDTLSSRVFISRHYQRSIRIDADYGRSDSLDGYIFQGTAYRVFESMLTQLSDTKQRAFTWTGPYGGGKSSLAVLLASALGLDPKIRTKARGLLDLKNLPLFDTAMPTRKGGWLVLPVVGKRGSVVQEIKGTLLRSLPTQKESSTLKQVTPTSLIKELCELSENSRFDGVLLIIDEMGKFLEATASGGDDVYFFQELAEAAARSKGNLVVIGILHQSFKQYAERLGLDSRDEWAKIQGRFVDIPFIAPSDENVELIGQAISSDVIHPTTLPIAETVASSIMKRRPSVGNNFAKSLDRCWPLHPTMAALLGPASKRHFAQNERSIFAFLTSAEPFGFQSFLKENICDEQSFYCPHNYWDFLHTNLEPAILASPDGHRWAQALEAIERTMARATDLHISLIKNIAVIDLFRNSSGLAPEDSILFSIHSQDQPDLIKQALSDLENWKITIFRKHIGAWSIFDGSDFDIESAISYARATIPALDPNLLMKNTNLHPILAKKHYHETGTLRWMSVSICELGNLYQNIENFTPANGEFGQFLLVIPEYGVSLKAAHEQIALLVNAALGKMHPLILGLSENYMQIHEIGLELQTLKKVLERPELEGDSVARREVLSRIGTVRRNLEEALAESFSIASWQGVEKHDKEKTRLSHIASRLANKIYKQSPRFFNELVNRDSISPNSVKARRDLLYSMLNHDHEEGLGIQGFPAERGLYESIIKNNGLHYYDTERSHWCFGPPYLPAGQHLMPIWQATKSFFLNIEKLIPVQTIYSQWLDAPFGVRAGIHPILLMAFIQSYKDNIAVYKEGMFISRLCEPDIDELLHDPKRFSLRWIEIDQDRVLILNGITKILHSLNGGENILDPLGAARALVALVLNLPNWVQRTRRISDLASSIRDSLLKANDPHKVLFVDLVTLLKSTSADDYIKALHSPLMELATAYQSLLNMATERMLEALDSNLNDIDSLRERAKKLAGISGDFRLDAFTSRLITFDRSQESIEGILSLAANKPPRDWNDRDIDLALFSIAEWALRFRQLEALLSVQNRTPTREAFAIVIGTGSSNKTISQSFDISEHEKIFVKDLASKIINKINNQGVKSKLLLAALAEASLSIIELEQ